MKKAFSVVFGVALLLVASSAFASNFRVADTVYLPAAIHGPGQAGAFFRTDVWISNLTNERIQVEVAFAPTSPNRAEPVNNENVTAPANLKRLAMPIDPGQRREVLDILQALFNVGDNPGASGMLIFFGVRDVAPPASPVTDCEVIPNDCRLISVQSRTYTTDANGNTYGQDIPGIPWYSYISVESQGVGLDTAFITGFRVGGNFRSNLGIANASQYSSTTIRVRLFAENSTTPFGEYSQSLRPLSHVQFSIPDVFPGFSGTGYVTLEQTSVTPTLPGDPKFGTGLPGFLAYGSMLDSRTNDPTTLEAQFTKSFEDDQALCIFGTGKTPPKRAVRHR